MNGNTSEVGQIQVIVDDAADRRLADRLVRAGLPVASVSRHALGGPVRGTVYLATGIRASDVDVRGIARAGAHLWLLPPFPELPLTLATGGVVTFAPAGRRAGVYLSRPIVEAVDSSVIPARPLRILYRERIAGGASTILAESTDGEMLVGAMPRASNLHGQIVISALLLGTASAQTDFDDVAILVRALVGWCRADEAVPAGEPAATQHQVSTAVASDHDARLVLLALALALAAAQRNASEVTTVPRAAVQHVFERMSALLGETSSEQTLASGWSWLYDHGVLLDATAGAAAHVDPAKMREFVRMWQLQPRLRRLSRVPL